MMLILALVVIVGFALYVMTPEERARAGRTAVTIILRVRDEAARRRSEPDPFRDALRERTPLAVVTPAIVVLNAVVFVLMLFAPGAFSDSATLIGWGGNFAPRTTNGEWSRLATALFVHAGLLHLLIDIAALARVGLVAERLVGPFTFMGVYVGAGALSFVASLSSEPMSVTVGSSGAIFGIYGLLVATMMWSGFHVWRRRRDEIRECSELPLSDPEPPRIVIIPLKVLKHLGPTATIFFLYYGANGFGTSEITGLVTGAVCGLLLTKDVIERKPRVAHAAAALAAAATIIVAAAMFQDEVADLRPEIARVVALEHRTVSEYDDAVNQFKKGRLSVGALAERIDKRIMPDLQSMGARLKAITGVPQEHQPLLAGTTDYLRLRIESWRTRSDALHKRSIPALQKAELSERAALEAFKPIAAAASLLAPALKQP